MYVRCFRDAFFIGSNEKLCNICRTLCNSHYGTNLTLSTGGRTDDNIDQYPAMVLYWRPLAYKSDKKIATSTRDAQ